MPRSKSRAPATEERARTTNSHRSPGESRRDREAVLQLAWSPFELFSTGRIPEGLALLDDGGTWWTNANRAEIPMTAMKTLMAKIFTVIPMTFDLIDATVEGDRGVLLAESRGASDDIAYHGVYSFIVDLDPRRDVIVSVREYADTDHGNRVLTPLLARVAQEQGIGADLAGLVDGAGQ